ncbi:MAG: P-loop NTPase [Phycisphaerae bacterium]|nr:P-loop NTPase [Phycisphaerae bacterium]
MKIAITSGKGGVGKTFVATCLADSLAKKQKVSFIDCDVEAPNAHLFLKPTDVEKKPQFNNCVEGFDPDKCDLCGKCSHACYFNAIVVGKKTAMVFPELCRWCQACQLVCPKDALIIGQRKIGDIYNSNCDGIDLHWGTLQAGAGGMTVKLIEMLKTTPKNEFVILDSPPGTSCPVVNTIKDTDHVVLVTDPTRFGIHDLKLSVKMCQAMNIEPCIIINRAETGNLKALQNWCISQQLEIIGQIPDSKEIAQCYSTGQLPTNQIDGLQEIFDNIAAKLTQRPIAKSSKATLLQEPMYLARYKDYEKREIADSMVSPKEITIISGKGGSGKTSLAACFGQLAKGTVGDCDVDASDLHLLFKPDILECEKFIGGRKMVINTEKCTICSQCHNICQFNAVKQNENKTYQIVDNCEGCGACLHVCPVDAIDQKDSIDGRWYFSNIRYGKMSHATLNPGMENSGKLVTLVRKNAANRINVHDINRPVVLDGAPGTGCPVIASIGATSYAVLVTEPTVSGLHDLQRIIELVQHFKIKAGIIINKSDINLDISEKIVKCGKDNNIEVLGQLGYSPLFTAAQQQGQTLLEYADNCPLAKEIRIIWQKIISKLSL